jgi:hypothetical protein
MRTGGARGGGSVPSWKPFIVEVMSPAAGHPELMTKFAVKCCSGIALNFPQRSLFISAVRPTPIDLVQTMFIWNVSPAAKTFGTLMGLLSFTRNDWVAGTPEHVLIK